MMKKYLKYVFIFVIILIAGGYFMNPNIVYFFNVQSCRDDIAKSMKDPDSTKILSYVVEKNMNDALSDPNFDPQTFSGNTYDGIKISGTYKATNSYGAFIQGDFICKKGDDGKIQSSILR